MRVYVCTDFQFSRDGITSQKLAKGDVVDIPDYMAPGLIFEGFAKEYVEPKSVPVPVIAAAEANKTIFAADENKTYDRRRKG